MINNVVLAGRLTKDPDLRYTNTGKEVTLFTLAVNRSFTNGEGKREADFIQCVIWQKKAVTLAEYARKGALISVIGRIQTRSYTDANNQKQYVTEVVCDEFQFLESKEVAESRLTTVYQSKQIEKSKETHSAGTTQEEIKDVFGDFQPEAINIPSDDEFPF